MATDILMPKMGESVQEGTILRWLKKPGDHVDRDEIIAEISTDKVDTEIPSSNEGTLLEILAAEGETVAVGNVIARLGAEGEAAAGGAPSGGGAGASTEQADAGPEAQPGEGEALAASVAPEVTREAEQVADAPAAQTEAPKAPAAQAEAAPAEQPPAQSNGSAEQAAAPAAAPASGGERKEVVMPKMGESVQEGTILRWLKKPGDTIERDEIIAEISTDKVDTEIPSSIEGTLLEIVAAEGETVAVGNVIAYIGSGAPSAGGAAPSAPAPQQAAAPSAAPQAPQSSPAPQASSAPVAAPSAPPSSPAAAAVVGASTHTNGGSNGAGPIPRMSNGRFYSPLVRSMAEAEGVSVAELDAVKGSGAEGRVTKDDLKSYLTTRTKSAPATQPAEPATQPGAAPATAPKSAPAGAPSFAMSAPSGASYGDDVEVVPMDRMRQLIAEHMVRSKHTSPHVTEVGEADVTGLVRLREGQKKAFLDRQGIKLTYTPFFVAAVAKALRDNPWVNSSVDGTNVLVKKRVNVGVATALPDGNLIVPVIKDADRMNVSGLAHAVSDLANRARSKALAPDDIAGGTFTLTNYGVFNLLHGAPIISQPQVAILGTGAIQKRPVVREIDGQDMIVIRSMIYLSLSHDHRIIDGLLGGKFLSDIIKNLEAFNENSTL